MTLQLSGGRNIDADAVVLATPWHVATRILAAAGVATMPPAGPQSLPASPITGLHLWFDRSVTPLPHVVFVDAVTHWLFADPIDDRVVEHRTEHYYQVVISGSHRLGDQPDELLRRVLGEINEAFPLSGARLLRHKMVTDPQSVFSVTPATERQRPESRTEHPRVVLAGDWVRTGWPATMEGAVRSGQLAAAALTGVGEPIDELPRRWLARRLMRPEPAGLQAGLNLGGSSYQGRR